MPRKNKPQALAATDFTPLDIQQSEKKRLISPSHLALVMVILLAVALMVYLLLARAIIFRLDPVDANVDTFGLTFHIGDNYLFLPGKHQIKVMAKGYFPLEDTITVSDQPSQEISYKLQALPGHLQIQSDLSDIQLSIDDETVGQVPGLIENVSQGRHTLTFSKYRYFPFTQQLDVLGLDTTQTLSVELLPAWGLLNISSAPIGATVLIDGREMGKTPLQTEVLETGSQLTLQLEGYKQWQQTVTVKAGTNAEYPPIDLVVADGLVSINSSPSAASVTINNQFKGLTPLQVALSPLKTHQLMLFKEGYFQKQQSLTVKAEQESTLDIKLQPNLADIIVNVSPADAELLVDGRSVGAGSRTLSLTATEHQLNIRRDGYQSQTTTVVPRPGNRQSLSIKLLTIEQAYWSTRPQQIRSSVDFDMKLFRPDGANFIMGAPRREPGRRANEAERNVSLQRPFYISTHEITNEQFRRWKAEHSSTAIKGFTLDMEQQPVVKVSWQDAALFCNWLSRQEGFPPFYQLKDNRVSGFDWQSHGYRLPTEAEWAYVAKIDDGGQAIIFPWSNGVYPPASVSGNYADQSAERLLSFTLANYLDKYPVSAPVGVFKPNSRGLFDIDGNVAEWTNDYYDVRSYRGDSLLDPHGPESGNRHVVRGASWALASRTELRLSYRDAGEDGRLDVGFRVARYVDKPSGEL
jgi:formylglycine-generating enzyme required for sulfatase activity